MWEHSLIPLGMPCGRTVLLTVEGRQHCLCPDIFLPTTGDHFYKRNKNLPPEEQMISALPDIKVLTINDDHDFMVIACDGIW